VCVSVFFFPIYVCVYVCVAAGGVPPAVPAGLGDGAASKDSPSTRSNTKPSGERSAHQDSAQLYLYGVLTHTHTHTVTCVDTSTVLLSSGWSAFT